MKAVVLAAGRGTRMRPLTDGRPKPLFPVANVSLVQHLLEGLVSAGVEEAVLVVEYMGDAVRRSLGEEFRGVRLSYVEQSGARGTGEAVRTARHEVDDDFLVVNGDLFVEGEPIRELAGRGGNAVAVKEVADPEHYGSVVVGDGTVHDLVEKSASPPSNLVNAGIYRFTPEVFDALESVEPSERGEVELTDAVRRLDGVEAVEVGGFWLDVGYPWDLLEANARALEGLEPSVEGEVEDGATLRGEVSVGGGTVIRSGAYVEGPVAIGGDCVVGPNCHVRPYTSIGGGARVGNGVEVKNSILMGGASVGHQSYVGDSVLGRRCNLGAGTVTANLRHDGGRVRVEVKGELVDTGRRKLGAVLGDDAKTGVNTSLNPGTVIGEGLYTEPGEYVRGTRL